VLQPHLAARDGAATEREKRRQRGIDGRSAPARRMERRKEAYRHHREEKSALQETQRAGLEAAAILQEEAEAEEQRAGERHEGEGGARRQRPGIHAAVILQAT
jgi:hypothetical protein